MIVPEYNTMCPYKAWVAIFEKTSYNSIERDYDLLHNVYSMVYVCAGTVAYLCSIALFVLGS